MNKNTNIKDTLIQIHSVQQSFSLRYSISFLNFNLQFFPSYALSKNSLLFSSSALLLSDSSTPLHFHISPSFILFFEVISFLLPVTLLLMRFFSCFPSSFSLIQIVLWLFFFNPKRTYFIVDFFLIFPIDFPHCFLSPSLLNSFWTELDVWSTQYSIAYLFTGSFVRPETKVKSYAFHTSNFTSYEGETVWLITWNMKRAAIPENQVISITFCIPYL